MNRDNLGRFTSLKRWFKNLVIGTVKFLVFSGLVVGSVAALVAFYQYKAGDYEARASAEVEAPQNLDERWEANYKKDVELEMQRTGFVEEMKAYARAKAENNVKGSYVTKLEQHMK